MLCILYVTSVGALLGVVGVLIERMLPTGWPRRWVWSLTIPLSIALPGYYRGHHSWSVTGALDQQTRESMGRVIHGASLNLLDPAWWARTQACDPIINQIWLIVSGTILIWGLANVIRVSEIVRTNEDRGATESPLSSPTKLVPQPWDCSVRACWFPDGCSPCQACSADTSSVTKMSIGTHTTLTFSSSPRSQFC